MVGSGCPVHLAFREDPEEVSPLTGISAWLAGKQDLSNLGPEDAVLNADAFIRAGERCRHYPKSLPRAQSFNPPYARRQLLFFSSFAYAQRGEVTCFSFHSHLVVNLGSGF